MGPWHNGYSPERRKNGIPSHYFRLLRVNASIASLRCEDIFQRVSGYGADIARIAPQRAAGYSRQIRTQFFMRGFLCIPLPTSSPLPVLIPAAAPAFRLT
ncbi:hypothetical protein KM92DES2_10585 [uncultured Desulfovibrio sp.]|uniref:Uncharacterized protein n=1 Tax=uncultured Desulfovibrio sp. TaxID=167968 RepID=A0A212J601_9BACT|nr:hypothetical protein KM92DES2_10585 [uncultured Desulfovibrio sp.]